MEDYEPIPGFDCVEMKRQGAARIYEELKDLSPEEVAAYWHRRNEEFLKKVTEWREQAREVKLAS